MMGFRERIGIIVDKWVEFVRLMVCMAGNGDKLVEGKLFAVDIECLSEKEKAALDYRSDAFFRQAWIYLTSFTSFNTSFSCSEEAV